MPERAADGRGEGSESPPLVRDVPIERMVAALPLGLRRIVSVWRFEFRRTRTWARTSVWLALAVFPAAIMGLLRWNHNTAPEEVWGVVLYGLIPQAVCLLGLLLWVAPLVNSELEGRTWIYLAVRPGGKTSLLLGKYLNGVVWTSMAGAAGLTLAMFVGQPEVFHPLKLYLVLLLLVVCSACGYGAVYAALGALFPRRAIVTSVGYMLIFEVLISNIPAVVNQITIQYRLFNLLLSMMDWRMNSQSSIEVSGQPVGVHFAVLLLLIAIYLSIAILATWYREYATSEQS